jgi:hypothetical protein
MELYNKRLNRKVMRKFFLKKKVVKSGVDKGQLNIFIFYIYSKRIILILRAKFKIF